MSQFWTLSQVAATLRNGHQALDLFNLDTAITEMLHPKRRTAAPEGLNLQQLPKGSRARQLMEMFGLRAKPAEVPKPVPVLKGYEKRWMRVLDEARECNAETGSTDAKAYAVTGLITVAANGAWGRKMPEVNRFSWSTPVWVKKANEKRHGVMMIRAVLTHKQMLALLDNKSMHVYDTIDLLDTVSEFKAEDFPCLPKGARTMVPANCSSDPCGDYYGRFFIMPFRVAWIDQKTEVHKVEQEQEELARELASGRRQG